MSNWGADILKVAKGMGVSSMAEFSTTMHHFKKKLDSTIAKVHNNKNESGEIGLFGWKTNNQKGDLQSWLTIFPEQVYKTRHSIIRIVDGICTGIVKLNKKFSCHRKVVRQKMGTCAALRSANAF
jgi:glutamine synthetase adenylyltransferase